MQARLVLTALIVARPQPASTPPPPKASPSADRAAEALHRVGTDKLDQSGRVTLGVNGRLHHIGVDRTHAGTHILLLAHDLDVRIINATTREVLRELTIDPTKNYQGTGRPPGPTPRHPK